MAQRHRKEMSVIAEKAEAEQNRMIATRNKSLQLLNFHAQNTEEILTHAELLERNLRNTASALGSAGVAAEMARARSDRAVKDLQRHCEEAMRLALHFKLQFHGPVPSSVQRSQPSEVEQVPSEAEEVGQSVKGDDQTAPATHTMAVESPLSSQRSEEVKNTVDDAKKKTRKRRTFRRKKTSVIHPVGYSCTWCGSTVPDVSRLVFLPTVGGPVGSSPSHYCTWSCAKSWNLRYSPVMHKHTRDVLIDLEAGKLIAESHFRENQFIVRTRK